jgi:MFS transporter, putative metabolite:H+ symporter
VHDATDAPSATIRSALPTIVVAGLGYFVDLFDLLLFSVVRRSSLTALGSGSRLLEDGAWVQNAQLVGLMIGGIAWGIIGDKRGRRTVLFGSILMYSVAVRAAALCGGHRIGW